MKTSLTDERLRSLRISAQRLTRASAAADVHEAARAVVGIQAQDVRAAGLALRSRVTGLERTTVDQSQLVRTWAARGTLHLIDPDDLPWLHAVFGARNRARFETLLAKRGGLDLAREMLDDILAVLHDAPRDRAGVLAELAARGHPSLGPHALNVLIPWVASQGLALGLPDGRLRATEPPPAVDREEALATMAERYLLGYGPARAADLANWSGLPLGTVRRALEALGDTPREGDMLALPGTLDEKLHAIPPALLLAAFDTMMLGYRTREPLVAAEDNRRILPGGGMLRPVVLIDGVAAGTWRLEGAGRRRRVAIDWFRAPARSTSLDAEIRDVGRFLQLGGSMA